jgi:hypothetical protein
LAVEFFGDRVIVHIYVIIFVQSQSVRLNSLWECTNLV